MRDLMNYSPYGALCQAFIMQGLSYFCAEVIEKKDQMIAEQEENEKQGRIGLISARAWVGIAEDITERMEYFYQNNRIK